MDLNKNVAIRDSAQQYMQKKFEKAIEGGGRNLKIQLFYSWLAGPSGESSDCPTSVSFHSLSRSPVKSLLRRTPITSINAGLDNVRPSLACFYGAVSGSIGPLLQLRAIRPFITPVRRP